jgi:hypothetical protein
MVYNEKEKVDSKVDDVAEILSAKRIWKVLSFSNPCESSSLELVFIDEKVSYFYYYVYISLLVLNIDVIIVPILDEDCFM